MPTKLKGQKPMVNIIYANLAYGRLENYPLRFIGFGKKNRIKEE